MYIIFNAFKKKFRRIIFYKKKIPRKRFLTIKLQKHAYNTCVSCVYIKHGYYDLQSIYYYNS